MYIGSIQGKIKIAGIEYDGRYDEYENFFSVVGFLYGGKKDKYRRLYLKTAEGEKHLLPNVEKELEDPCKTFFSFYLRVNRDTVDDVLKRTEEKYKRMRAKHFEKHLDTIHSRQKYLSKIKAEGKEIIELIGGGSIVDVKFPEEQNNGIIRKIGNVAINISYRSMKLGTKIFSELTEIASNMHNTPANIITFRTSNPWIINGLVPNLKKNYGHNYVPIGESMRADGNGTVVQYMLFQKAKDNFEERLAYADTHHQTAWTVLKPFSDTIKEFMNEGVEKVSIRELKERHELLKAFPTPQQFESKGKSDEVYIEQYMQQTEGICNAAPKSSYREASKALYDEYGCDFLPDSFANLVSILNSFGCHDLEEFKTSDKRLVQTTYESAIPAVS